MPSGIEGVRDIWVAILVSVQWLVTLREGATFHDSSSGSNRPGVVRSPTAGAGETGGEKRWGGGGRLADECECIYHTNDGRTQGTFSSPNFPKSYATDVVCIVYTFVGDANTQIVEITLLEFDLPPPGLHNICSDYLRIYLDLESADQLMLESDPHSAHPHHRHDVTTRHNYELCGNISSVPKQHYSSAHLLFLKFHSERRPYASNYTGFRGIYKFIEKAQFAIGGGVLRRGTKCSYDFESPTDIGDSGLEGDAFNGGRDGERPGGQFFSPRYPQNYPPNAACQYVFRGAHDERVRVVFWNIQLEVVVDSNSCALSPDVLIVRDGSERSDPLVAIFCNTVNGETVMSSGPNLRIELTTDGRGQRQGFAAVYSFVSSETVRDGGISGNLGRAGKADISGWRDDFKWFSPPSSSTGKHSMETGGKWNERLDEIVPTLKTKEDAGAAAQQHNPGDSPVSFEQNVDSARHDDDNVGSLVTSGPQPSSFCDHTYASGKVKSGTIRSPLYPNSYSSDVTCRYTFQGQDRERVQISFNELNLRQQPLLPSGAGRGGAMGMAVDPIICDDVDSVTVSVMIREQPSNIGVYCGSKRPPKLMSPDNQLVVRFISRPVIGDMTTFLTTAATNVGAAGLKENYGFAADFNFVTDFGIKSGTREDDTACAFSFRSDLFPNGSFTSPNFPGLYPRNTECHYLFYGKDDERVNITFLYFDVEGIHPGCLDNTDSDYVEFSNFNIKLTDRKMSRFCGTRDSFASPGGSGGGSVGGVKGRSVISDSNFFRVTFRSNDQYDATGFEAFFQFRKNEDYHFPARGAPYIDSSSSAAVRVVIYFVTMTSSKTAYCQMLFFWSLTSILFQLLVDRWHRYSYRDDIFCESVRCVCDQQSNLPLEHIIRTGSTQLMK